MTVEYGGKAVAAKFAGDVERFWREVVSIGDGRFEPREKSVGRSGACLVLRHERQASVAQCVGPEERAVRRDAEEAAFDVVLFDTEVPLEFKDAGGDAVRWLESPPA